ARRLLIAMALLSNVPAKPGPTPEFLARRAISPHTFESLPAIAELRKLGPKGLDLLFQVNREQIIRLSAQSPRERASDPEWQRLTAALDSVSQQRDSYASRLYWYTDFEQPR